jgi:hypothetical protein
MGQPHETYLFNFVPPYLFRYTKSTSSRVLACSGWISGVLSVKIKGFYESKFASAFLPNSRAAIFLTSSRSNPFSRISNLFHQATAFSNPRLYSTVLRNSSHIISSIQSITPDHDHQRERLQLQTAKTAGTEAIQFEANHPPTTAMTSSLASDKAFGELFQNHLESLDARYENHLKNMQLACSKFCSDTIGTISTPYPALECKLG